MAEDQRVFTLIVTLLGAIASTFIFIYYSFSIYKILRTHNSQFKENEKRLDNYLITTLTLIGISVASLLAMSIIDTTYGSNSGPTENEVASHLRTLQQTIEKSAIFVDITRLTVLLIKLRNYTDKTAIYIRNVHIILGVSIFFLVLLDLLIQQIIFDDSSEDTKDAVLVAY